MIEPFNATVATTFFGFHRTNVDYELTNETIHDRRVVGYDGDIVYLNVSGCDRSDRNFGAIIHYSAMAIACVMAFLFELSLFSVFWKMTKTHGPSFYILLAMLLCSCVNIILFVFLLYFEATLGFRLPIPFNLDYYIKMPFGRGEAVFYFLYAINRSACLLAPFKCDIWFSKRNVKRIIFWGCLYTLLENSERLLANNGMNRAHCLAPEEMNDFIMTYFVIKDPLMFYVEKLSVCIYYVIWYGPALLDLITLTKLFLDKYTIRSMSPWFVARPMLAGQNGEFRSERIRLFVVCFCTSFFHLMFASLFSYLFDTLFGYEAARNIGHFYNHVYLVENLLPYLLILAISRDVRSGWLRKCKEILGKMRAASIAQKRKLCLLMRWRDQNSNRINSMF